MYVYDLIQITILRKDIVRYSFEKHGDLKLCHVVPYCPFFFRMYVCVYFLFFVLYIIGKTYFYV